MAVKANLSPDLAQLAYLKADFPECKRLYDERLQQQENSLGLKHEEVAVTLHSLGRLHYLMGHYGDAERSYNRAKEIFEETHGAEYPAVAVCLRKLSKISHLHGDETDSWRFSQQAIQIWHTYLLSLEPNKIQTSAVCNDIFEQKTLDETITNLPKLFTKLRASAPLFALPFSLLNSYEMGMLYKSRNQTTIAERLFRYALEETKLEPCQSGMIEVSILKNLAELTATQGSFENSSKLCRQALTLLCKSGIYSHPITAALLQQLGRNASSGGESQQLYEESLSIFQKTLGSKHPYVALVTRQIAQQYMVSRQYPEAEVQYKHAAAIFASTLKREQLEVYNDLAHLYLVLGRNDEAEAACLQALDLLAPTDIAKRGKKALIYDRLGVIYRIKEQFQKSEFAYKRALKLRQEIQLACQQSIAQTQINLAYFYLDWGKYLEAEKNFEAALAKVEEPDARRPTEQFQTKEIILESLLGFGNTPIQKDMEGLLPCVQSTTASGGELIRILNCNLITILQISCLTGLGIASQKQGRLKEAEIKLNNALTVLRDNAQKFSAIEKQLPDVVAKVLELAAVSALGDVQIARGNWREAEVTLTKAIKDIELSFSSHSNKVLPFLNLQAKVNLAQNRLEQARELFKNVIEKSESPSEPDYGSLLTALCQLGNVEESNEKAIDYFDRAVKLTTMPLPLRSYDVISALICYAKHAQKLGNPEDALEHLKICLSLGNRVLGGHHPMVAETLSSLGDFYAIQQNSTKAAEYYMRAIQVMDATLDSLHPKLASTLILLANVYSALGNESESKALLARSKNISKHFDEV
jgi:tetratricopeptide (TPR) repeat protein